jgi:lipoate-protein ligase A
VDFLDLTLPTVAENVALDESLLLSAEVGESGEVLRVWEQPSLSVVLGSGCKLADDVDLVATGRDGIPIVRRSSGGGTVLLGTGCLCYSLVLAYARAVELTEIASSYRWILDRVLESLKITGTTQEGISDLAIGGWKFSGNAQQRKRNHLLHHGTILYALDLNAIERYLRPPERQPEYRARRAHGAFIRNVEVVREQIIGGLRAVWDAGDERLMWSSEDVARLVREKYGTAEWTGRR